MQLKCWHNVPGVENSPSLLLSVNQVLTLSTKQGFPFLLALGTIVRGWALAGQGQAEEGIAHIHQGLTALNAMGAELFTRAHFLALLAEAYRKVGQPEEGLTLLAEALAVIDKTSERYYEAELYRLKGELTLQSRVQGLGSSVKKSGKLQASSLQHPAPNTQHPRGRGVFSQGH